MGGVMTMRRAGAIALGLGFSTSCKGTSRDTAAVVAHAATPAAEDTKLRPAASAASVQAQAPADVPAFPGAEGFGAKAKGGRGGHVCKVTSLAKSGPGTLASCLDLEGPRVVVFDTSGVID